MILALFLIIISVCVSNICSSFGIDFLFGPQTESEFEDYEETAKFLGFRKPEMVMDDGVTATELDVEEQTTMNIELTTMNIEKPNITRKIIRAPMRKFVYFTKPKLKTEELIDNDNDDEEGDEEGDEEDDITFEEIHRTTPAASDEDSAILQQENKDLSLDAEDIKSELTSEGITTKSNTFHLTILLTCLLILCHHRTLLYCQPIEIKIL